MQNSRIYVGGVRENIGNNQLEDVFGKYGKITDIKRNKFFSFIQFDSEDSAQNAISGENGKQHFGKTIEVQIAKQNTNSSFSNESAPSPNRERFEMLNYGRGGRGGPRGGGRGGGQDRFDSSRDSQMGGGGRGRGGFRGGSGSGSPYFQDDGDQFRGDDRFAPRDENPFNRDGGGFGRGRFRDEPREPFGRGRPDLPPRDDEFRPGPGPREGFGRGGPPRDFDGGFRGPRDSPGGFSRDGSFSSRDGAPFRGGGGGGGVGGGGGGGGGGVGGGGGGGPPSLLGDKPSTLPPPTHPPTTLSISHENRTNDIEIIAINKSITEYGEYIERRFKSLAFTVDLLFPNEEVPLPRVLANIASRGTLYAILVTPVHQQHRSLTLNILHGLPQEHRNMPIEDAVSLVSRNYEMYVMQCSEKRGALKPPEDIRALLDQSLAGDKPLTISQVDKILLFFTQEKAKIEMSNPSGTSGGPPKGASVQEQDLQNRILNILNKGGSGPPVMSGPPPPGPVQQPPQPTQPNQQKPLLSDPSVQKALDSLIQGFTPNRMMR